MTRSQKLRLGSCLLAFLPACDDAPLQEIGGGGSASVSVGGSADQGGGGADATAGGAAGSGGEAEAPTCASHTGCGGDFHGSWVLEADCDEPIPQQVPLYCEEGCVSAAPECASSFVVVTFHLDAAELSFEGTTFAWTGTGEQHATLHVELACAVASGHDDLADACATTALGDQYLSGLAEDCHVEGDECLCSAVFPLEYGQGGAFVEEGDGTLTAENLELEQCAAGDGLWVGTHGGYPPQLYRRR